MENLLKIMRQLRAPDGCPWDREQTHSSLRPYLLEEACEAIDAITQNDDEAMTEELGDVLLQVAFHAVIAEEDARFDYAQIEKSIVDKLIRRHPHIFGDVEANTAEAVYKNWQQIKNAEKAAKKNNTKNDVADDTRDNAISEIRAHTSNLPALAKAFEIGKKLEWSAPTIDELTEHSQAFYNQPNEENLGRLLLKLSNFARAKRIHPDNALRDAIEKEF